MGNPASVKRKLTEKRRKRHEQRVGPGTYLPKDLRLELQAELAKVTAAEAVTKAEAAVERANKKKAKAAEAPKA